jgi:ATPase subunit of ABC transporter with duplicated ATPase domains
VKVAETMAVLEEFNQINDSFGLPEVYEDAKMDKLMDRQALLQDKIDALGAWEIDTKLEIAMDALRTLMQISIKNLSGGERRRVALCRYFSNLMFYYWMSLPITWMQKAYCG